MLKKLYDTILGKKWIAATWTFLILAACTWPGKDIPAAPVVGFDKIVHAGLFMVWSILWLSVYSKKIALIIFIGIIYGITLEFYQQLLPFDRTFDWWDAVADAGGVVLGYGFKQLILDPYRQRLY
jgi:hypothetical protein